MSKRKPPEEKRIDEYEKQLNAFVRFADSPEGQIVLDVLDRTFNRTTAVGALLTTGAIDTNKVLVHAGARLVYQKIVGLIEEGRIYARNTANSSTDKRNATDLDDGPSVFDA